MCLSTCSPVRMEQLGPTRRIFVKFDLSIFRKSVESIQVSLKSDKNNGYYMKTSVHFLLYIAQFFLEWEILQTKVAKKIKIHISHSITSFQKWCCGRGNVEKYVETDIPQMRMWCMCIACWITKATNTYSKYVTGSQISWQQHRMVVRSGLHQLLLPLGNTPGTHFC